MKPKLVALEEKAERALDDVVAEARSEKTRVRWQAFDALLASLGREIGSLLIIFLALAILCAPVGLGLVAIYYLSSWAMQATHSRAIGWIVAIASFAFLCRYVWGVRLQRAARRAAEAIIAAKTD